MTITLEYHYRDPISGEVQCHSPEEAAAFFSETRKPVILTTLGINSFSKETSAETQLRYIEAFCDQHETQNVSVIVITTNGSKAIEKKLYSYLDDAIKRIEHKDDNPTSYSNYYKQQYQAPNNYSLQIMKDLFAPNLPEKGNDKASKRLLQCKTLLSKCNLLAHSFGTMIQAELGEFVAFSLKDKGYNTHEVTECMQSIGRLHLGHAYDPQHVKTMIPGIDCMAANDRTTNQYLPKRTIRQHAIIDGNHYIFQPNMHQSSVDLLY